MGKRKIFIGADSAGFEMKNALTETLRGEGWDVTDCGCFSSESNHYPDFARVVCKNVQEAPDECFGILVCGTGIGMSMAANKHRGIRAAVCGDTFSARFTRLHNNANVLCMGARVIGIGLATDITHLFLETEFESGGRHEARVNMIGEIEAEEAR